MKYKILLILFFPYYLLASENEFYQTVSLGPSVYEMGLNPGDFNNFTQEDRSYDKLKGLLFGPELLYQLEIAQKLCFQAKGSWTMGDISSNQMNIYTHNLHLEFLVGPKFVLERKNTISITPFTGLSFQAYYNNFRESDTDISGKMRFKKISVPIGVLASYSLNPRLLAGVQFVWNFDIDSNLDIDELPGVKWDLSNEYLVKLSLPVTFKLSQEKKWCINASPFWSRNAYGSTKLDADGVSFYYPKQTYTSWGATLSIQNQF